MTAHESCTPGLQEGSGVSSPPETAFVALGRKFLSLLSFVSSMGLVSLPLPLKRMSGHRKSLYVCRVLGLSLRKEKKEQDGEKGKKRREEMGRGRNRRGWKRGKKGVERYSPDFKQSQTRKRTKQNTSEDPSRTPSSDVLAIFYPDLTLLKISFQNLKPGQPT